MKWAMIGFLAFTGLAACETIQGAGRDVQNAGETLEKAVE